MVRYFCLILLGFLAFGSVFADEMPESNIKKTGLPIPRFVSLSSDTVHMRAGPGTRYPVKWVYNKKHLPVEIIQEFDHWRKIKDIDGTIGWVHKSLLSGDRYVLTTLVDADEAFIPVFETPEPYDLVLARLEAKVVAELKKCEESACQIMVGGYKGWIEKKFIYGIYDDDELN